MDGQKRLQARDLFVLVQTWQRAREVPACPVCDSAEFAIKDVSARPHTEWYKLTCPTCGFDQTITRPMASHP